MEDLVVSLEYIVTNGLGLQHTRVYSVYSEIDIPKVIFSSEFCKFNDLMEEFYKKAQKCNLKISYSIAIIFGSLEKSIIDCSEEDFFRKISTVERKPGKPLGLLMVNFFDNEIGLEFQIEEGK